MIVREKKNFHGSDDLKNSLSSYRTNLKTKKQFLEYQKVICGVFFELILGEMSDVTGYVSDSTAQPRSERKTLYMMLLYCSSGSYLFFEIDLKCQKVPYCYGHHA